MKYTDKSFRWDTEYLVNEWVEVLYYSYPPQRVLIYYPLKLWESKLHKLFVIDKLQKPFEIIEEETKELCLLKGFIAAKELGWKINNNNVDFCYKGDRDD